MKKTYRVASVVLERTTRGTTDHVAGLLLSNTPSISRSGTGVGVVRADGVRVGAGRRLRADASHEASESDGEHREEHIAEKLSKLYDK